MKFSSVSKLLAVVGLLSLVACKKSVENPEPPPTEPESLPRLVKLVGSYVYKNRIGAYTDSISYEYDSQRRLTKVTDLNTNGANAYEYEGDKLVTRKELGANGEVAFEFTDFLEISDDNKEFKFTYIYPSFQVADANDTVLIYYSFDDKGKHIRFHNYVDLAHNNAPFGNDEYYLYGSDGNLQVHDTAGVYFRVLETDDKKNYFAEVSNLEYLLLYVTGYSKRSVNNATKVQDYFGQIFTIEYEYNDRGYPVKMIYHDHPDYEGEIRFVYED